MKTKLGLLLLEGCERKGTKIEYSGNMGFDRIKTNLWTTGLPVPVF
jgi:hypothetical protein